MNIFCIYPEPCKSAKHLCDVHCNKMLLESAQLIANCFPHSVLAHAPKTKKNSIRKYSYEKHPSSIWTRQTKSNLSWLIDHALGIEQERLSRGYNPHFSASFVDWAKQNIDQSSNPSGELTPFSVAIADEMECRKIEDFDKLNPVTQYRLYYKLDKAHLATWKQNKPKWYDYSVEKLIEAKI